MTAEITEPQTSSEHISLTYDELKAGLESDLRALIALRDNPDTNLSTAEQVQITKQIADIRVKLTEKFGTTEQSGEQRVVVLTKFDSICPYCGREICIGPR